MEKKSNSSDDPEVIEPEILEPEAEKQSSQDEATDKQSKLSKLKLHSWSGLLIILVDNTFFAATAATAGLALPWACFLAFSLTTAGVFLIQKFLAGDDTWTAMAKAFFSGILAGVPTSISGTAFGSAVLLLSGISSNTLDKK